MPVQSKSKWFRGLIVTLGPLVLILAGVWLAAPADSVAGVVALAADEEDLAREYLLQAEAFQGAFLGVSLEEETDYEEGGARVTHVAADSPAAKAGLQEGDIIVGFEGGTIRGPVGLTKQIHTRKPGDSVAIVVLRDGSRQTLVAELGDRAESSGWLVVPEMPDFEDLRLTFDEERLGAQIDKSLAQLEDWKLLRHCDEEDDEDCLPEYRSFFMDWSGRPLLGVQLVEATPELRRHLGAGEDAGVLVSKIVAGSPAESAGIRVGDLIVAVEGEEISDSRDLRGELRDKTGETFQVEVIRDGTPMSIEVTIPEPDTERPTGPRAGVMPPMRAPRVEAVAAPRVHPAPVAPVAPAPAGVRPAQPAVPAPPAQVEWRTRTELVRRLEAERESMARERHRAQERAVRQYEAARLAAERTAGTRDRALAAYERAVRDAERQKARRSRAPVLL